MSNKTRREFISSVPSSCLFVLALAVVLPGSLEGQRQFEFAGKRHLPGISTRTLGAAAADLDGDGDLDLVTGDVGVSNHIYINDGSGKFTLPAKWQIYSKDDTRGFALADFTGNGEIEIYVANFGRDQIYVRNKARGFWQNSNFRFDDIATESVVAADIDGDGDKDLILGVAGAANRIFINNGVSNFRNWFTDETQTRLPAQAREISNAVLAIDVDGDKDLDLVFANWLGQHRLYLNDGKGVFKEVTATHFPKSGEPTLDAAAADVDGDGDLDLIFSQLTTTAVKQTPALRLFLNNGKGMFTEARKGSLPVIEGDVSSVDFGDLDQDGDRGPRARHGHQ